MHLRRLLLIVFVGLVLVGASPDKGSAQDLTIMVNRGHDTTELYFSARADVLFDMFGASQNLLADSAGLVNFRHLRQGTYDIADTLLADTLTLIGQNSVGFEAMSLMVHPLTEKLPIRTPLDAMIAIGVCTGPSDGKLVALRGLQAYVGYFTDIDSLDKVVSIELPHAGVLFTTVHDFGLEGHMASYQTAIVGGGPILLGPQAHSSNPVLLVVLALIAASAIGWTTLTQNKREPVALFWV